MRWRYLISPAASGAWNMALDEVLMSRAAETGEPVLRIYGWSTPTLSLGRNQPARGAYDLERASRRGIEFVRRPTGGRALLHHREVTYSVTAPVGGLGDLGESYDRVNRLLVEGLRALGVPACVAEVTGLAPQPSLAPCFERPVSGEIVVEGRKLVGSAQYREGGALLQHGSILVEDDQLLATALLNESADVAPAPATLTALLDAPPNTSDVAECLIIALRELEDRAASPLAIDGPLEWRTRSALARYQDEEWTWRR